MTCNDCIHIEACLSHVPRTFWDSDFYKNCDHFKDKNKIIELPCKVGDVIYSPELEMGFDAVIDHITITKEFIYYDWVQYEKKPRIDRGLGCRKF